MVEIRRARARVTRMRSGAIDRERLFAARLALLRALESYAEELTVRGLPIPGRLRDELRLQRDVHEWHALSRNDIRRGGRNS
jgi:hypothetical protein